MEWDRQKLQLPKPQVVGVLPTLPQWPCPVVVCWSWRSAGDHSAVGCAEAAAGWEPSFLILSDVQGGPHCITPGASVPGFAASWAPGGGTLPVFQQTINHFLFLVLPVSNWFPRAATHACFFSSWKPPFCFMMPRVLPGQPFEG